MVIGSRLAPRKLLMRHWSSGLGRRPLKAETMGPNPVWRTTSPGRIRTQNPPPDFDRDYPARQMPVIAGEARGNGKGSQGHWVLSRAALL